MKKAYLLLLILLSSFACIQNSFAVTFTKTYIGAVGVSTPPKSLEDIYFVPGPTNDVVIAVGHMKAIWRSADKGVTWTQVSGDVVDDVTFTGTDTSEWLHGIGFVDSQTGFACGGVNNTATLLFYTSDGGVTWTDIKDQLPPTVTVKLYGVCPVDASTAYLYGNGGTLVKASKNEGIWSFTKISSGVFTGTFYGLDFAGSTAFTAASASKLRKRIDIENEEEAWTLAAGTENAADLRDVKFYDNSNGLTVGQTGQIFRTTDGGANWTSVVSGQTILFRKFTYESSTTAYAVGNNGKIVESNNGGATWASSTSNTTRTIYSIASKNGLTLAACYYGEILKYSTQITTGVNNNVENIDLSAYFSANGDFLNLKSVDSEIVSAVVLDVSGRTLLSVDRYDGNPIYTGNMNKGAYFVRINTNEGENIIKVLKL